MGAIERRLPEPGPGVLTFRDRETTQPESGWRVTAGDLWETGMRAAWCSVVEPREDPVSTVYQADSGIPGLPSLLEPTIISQVATFDLAPNPERTPKTVRQQSSPSVSLHQGHLSYKQQLNPL
ncbi:hypothetical protein NDU88_010181 [Pleurodeles waltl]|uniref:Uncharacterized protein n=1 Tax=Pleurodeles waltl TaxID=8319 RepID=A0AAV7QTN7_PLEWA|nr:hypothetical protein NDU88_010181 [Pleurodeles waltl]